jgi:hypothetical protein
MLPSEEICLYELTLHYLQPQRKASAGNCGHSCSCSIYSPMWSTASSCAETVGITFSNLREGLGMHIHLITMDNKQWFYS